MHYLRINSRTKSLYKGKFKYALVTKTGMLDVVTMGSAVYDIFIKTDANHTEILKLTHPDEKREHIAFPTGAKILINEAFFDIGGASTNAATSFSRLGLKAGALCKVGHDIYGHKILQNLKDEKVKFLGSISQEHTDFSIVLDCTGHDRTILAYKGASNTIKPSDVKSLDTKWLYVSTLMGKSFETCERLIKKTKSKIAFNPNTYMCQLGQQRLAPLLAKTSFLVLNKEEAMQITDKVNIEVMLNDLASMGPETVIITDGENGAHCKSTQGTYLAVPHKNAPIVETTGAGDAFASSVLAGMIKTGDIKYSLQLGITNAESVISQFGAHNKLLTWKEAERSIKKDPSRVLKKR